jgi:hypothetical protein
VLLLQCHSATVYNKSFIVSFLTSCTYSTLLELGQDFIASEEKHTITLGLQLHATEIREQHFVTHRHTSGDKVAIVASVSGTHSENLSLIGLLVTSIGKDETASSLQYTNTYCIDDKN